LTLDKQRFDELYRRHAANAFRRARQLLGSDADGHEVVHDVFLSLYERPTQFEGRSGLSTFLYSAVTHACLNRIRDRSNQRRLLAQHAASLPAPSAERLPAERAATLRRLLERLPEPLGHVAVYYYMDDLSQDEIARVVGCSRSHVGDLLERLATWIERQEQLECSG
jgi:RNA polymerase sigma factor (sigma-70 family)